MSFFVWLPRVLLLVLKLIQNIGLASERAIKIFVQGRRNWLFCNTSKGASSSATIYSVVETAKSNGLVVEKYLTYLMDVICNLEIKDETTLLQHMPWSQNLPEDLKLQNSNLHGKEA